MTEEVLFESESTLTREAVADYLRTLADGLADGGPVTLSAGDQELTLDPPGTVTFEVKAEREYDGTEERSLEVELEWDADGETGTDADLTISAEDL